MGLTYLPYLHHFYAPAAARAAFVAVRDLAAPHGGHIIGIPRDDLPILEKQNGSGALWTAESAWEEITAYRQYPGARRAILAFGAPAFLGAEAAAILQQEDLPVDVFIVNGLPLAATTLHDLLSNYNEGVVTIEDGVIGTAETGLRGFAALVANAASGQPRAHLGITDPRIAPSAGHLETWTHFGLTATALTEAVKGL